MSRIRTVVVGATAVELAKAAPDRVAIRFAVGDPTNASSVMVRDGSLAATATAGWPITIGETVFMGKLAQERFTGIRLAGVDAVVAIVEEFPEHLVKPPTEGIKV